MTPTATVRTVRTMRPTIAFLTLALGTVILTAAASAPSPLYPLYRERWQFSVTLLTVVFAVYVAGLLAALLTVGSLSDQCGRRPVLVAGFVLAATSSALFWSADGPAALVLARLVQGAATGTATSALTAALLDLAPAARPHLAATVSSVAMGVGMACGAGFAGLLSMSTTSPDRVVFPALTFAFVALAVASLALPETVRRAARVRPRVCAKVRVGATARPTFRMTMPSTVASWAAGGLFLGLIPSLVRDVLQVKFAAAGGLSITVLYLAVTLGGLWAVRHHPATAAVIGSGLMTAGATSLALGLVLGSVAGFVLAALGLGLGSGLTLAGNLRAVSAATSAHERSETVAAVYVLSYASLSVPTLVAGLLVPVAGLRTTGLGFIVLVGLLSGVAFVGPLVRSRRRVSEPGPRSRRA